MKTENKFDLDSEEGLEAGKKFMDQFEKLIIVFQFVK